MKTAVRGKTVKVICKNKPCGLEFEVREADRKRGWGLFCSKSCKASRQTYLTGRGKPKERTPEAENESIMNELRDEDFGYFPGDHPRD